MESLKQKASPHSLTLQGNKSMSATEPTQLVVTVEHRGRVDAAVAQIADISRTKAVQWIQRGLVTVNGELL